MPWRRTPSRCSRRGPTPSAPSPAPLGRAVSLPAGLSPFFVGREADVSRVVAALDHLDAAGLPRILVLSAARGSGLRSLVHAGVVPKLLATRGGTAQTLRRRPGGGVEESGCSWPRGSAISSGRGRTAPRRGSSACAPWRSPRAAPPSCSWSHRRSWAAVGSSSSTSGGPAWTASAAARPTTCCWHSRAGALQVAVEGPPEAAGLTLDPRAAAQGGGGLGGGGEPRRRLGAALLAAVGGGGRQRQTLAAYEDRGGDGGGAIASRCEEALAALPASSAPWPRTSWSPSARRAPAPPAAASGRAVPGAPARPEAP